MHLSRRGVGLANRYGISGNKVFNDVENVVHTKLTILRMDIKMATFIKFIRKELGILSP